MASRLLAANTVDLPFSIRIAVMGIKTYWVSCASLKECADEWVKVRERQLIASSECRRGCGDVFRDGRKVASVSYNGRTWVDGKPLDGMSEREWLSCAS